MSPSSTTRALTTCAPAPSSKSSPIKCAVTCLSLIISAMANNTPPPHTLAIVIFGLRWTSLILSVTPWFAILFNLNGIEVSLSIFIEPEAPGIKTNPVVWVSSVVSACNS